MVIDVYAAKGLLLTVDYPVSEVRLIFVQFVGYKPIINQDQQKG